jgi:hypothetical protein
MKSGDKSSKNGSTSASKKNVGSSLWECSRANDEDLLIKSIPLEEK